MKKPTEIPFGSKESGTELSDHFTSFPHDAKDMRVHILDHNPKWKKIERLVLEDYYMCKLKTIEPDGLNTKHGMFAKLFYNDYRMLSHFSFLISSSIFHSFLSLFSFIYFCFGVMVILYDTWIPNTRPRVII